MQAASATGCLDCTKGHKNQIISFEFAAAVAVVDYFFFIFIFQEIISALEERERLRIFFFEMFASTLNEECECVLSFAFLCFAIHCLFVVIQYYIICSFYVNFFLFFLFLIFAFSLRFSE